MTGIRHKQRAYQANGIPALFVYPRDLEGSDWSGQLYEKLEQIRQQPIGPVAQNYIDRNVLSSGTR
jgi:hypothetical protein